MLQALIDRYGKGAVLTVGPYMPDSSGEIFRWVALIDGADVPEVDVRVHDEGDWRALLLVVGDEEYELLKWNPSKPTRTQGAREERLDAWWTTTLSRRGVEGRGRKNAPAV